MKLSDAMQNIIGVCDKTAWNMWKPGELDAYQLPSGTIIVNNNINSSQCKFVKVAIYCRVSICNNKPNLGSQAERLLNYCYAQRLFCCQSC
ncbi:MAG: hypothetical protein O4808_15370 [Trichodesmium sp. St17_bin3_1_1]|nr:hypothetical protein [Trichodesmium sp. St17_bin3_1_1]